MVEIVQTFNGEERRVIGRPRTNGGVNRMVRSILAAGGGWGVFIRGTKDALRAIGAMPTAPHEWILELTGNDGRIIGCWITP